MKEIWVLSVRTSLPHVCEHTGDLKLEIQCFDSFSKARTGVREKLKSYAFSKNSMFDGKGNMIYMKKYMDSIEDFDGCEDDEGFLSSQVGAKLLALFKDIFMGKDTAPDLECQSYGDGFIEVDLKPDSIAFWGMDDGPCNGYDPMANTNMFSMQEEKDYYLHLNDLFGWSDAEASSELYMDLRKVKVQ